MKTIIRRLSRSHKSMTIWFNGLMCALIAALPELLVFLPELRESLGDDHYRPLVLLTVIGNIALRVKTTKPMEEK